MQGFNCIMVYNKDKSKLLFCKRTKEPYLGLYNLVGGKIEIGEDGYEAAHRELWEETGISKQNIQLHHMMDFTYYNQECYVEVYAGHLNSDIELKEEAHPLYWLDMDENFFDLNRFAGEGNIGHMVEQVKGYGMGVPGPDTIFPYEVLLNNNTICIGVDGCKGGWITAILDHGELKIEKYNSLEDIVNRYPRFDEFLLDMIIGLPSKKEHIRPETYARKIIIERTSTIFPAPSRQAVYAETVSLAYEENERVLGKKFTPLTVGILPKIRETDLFMQSNPYYKNVIKESHPEVCYAKLNGKTVLTKKSEINGIEERIEILSKYMPEINYSKITADAKYCKCNADDIMDAICLAVAANLAAQGKYEVIPEFSMADETGLRMQLVIPKLK